MTVSAGVRRVGVAITALATPAAGPAAVIDFDHTAAGGTVSAVNYFGGPPLAEEYAMLGVHFAGPSANTGGVILNTAAAFGVRPTSGSNFLAFDQSRAAGPQPRGPETITFDTPMKLVTLNVAGGFNAYAFRMDAYGTGTKVLATATVTARAFATLLVQADGIRKVVVTNTTDGAETYVFDDLAYSATPEPAAPLLVLSGTGMALAPRRRRRQK